MDNSPNLTKFIEEWLNHFSIRYEKNLIINSTTHLDYYVNSDGLGIFIVEWKKPISVQIANKAIQIEKELKLSQLFLVSNEMSQTAKKTLRKFGENIVTIHPNGLSDLAIYLANLHHTNVSTAKV